MVNTPFMFFGSPTLMHSTGETTDGHFCLLEHLAMPPGLASPYHTHHNEDEAFYVLEGEVAFVVRRGVAGRRTGRVRLRPARDPAWLQGGRIDPRPHADSLCAGRIRAVRARAQRPH